MHVPDGGFLARIAAIARQNARRRSESIGNDRVGKAQVIALTVKEAEERRLVVGAVVAEHAGRRLAVVPGLILVERTGEVVDGVAAAVKVDAIVVRVGPVQGNPGRTGRKVVHVDVLDQTEIHPVLMFQDAFLMHVVQLDGAGDQIRAGSRSVAAREHPGREAFLDRNGVLRACLQGLFSGNRLGDGIGGTVGIHHRHGEGFTADGDVFPAALGIGRQHAVGAEFDVLQIHGNVLSEALHQHFRGIGHPGRKGEDELHDAAPVQGSAGMVGHPGVGERDFGEIGLGDVAQPGREDQMVRAAVAGLGQCGIAGFGLGGGFVGSGADDVKDTARHFGTGETRLMVREALIDLIDRGSVAADDPDAVAFLPDQVQASPLVRNGESRFGKRLFRKRGADGQHWPLHLGHVIFANTSGQYKKQYCQSKKQDFFIHDYQVISL